MAKLDGSDCADHHRSNKCSVSSENAAAIEFLLNHSGQFQCGVTTTNIAANRKVGSSHWFYDTREYVPVPLDQLQSPIHNVQHSLRNSHVRPSYGQRQVAHGLVLSNCVADPSVK